MTRAPWHVGERSLHARLGLTARMDELGSRVIRDHMPDQHREFFAQLPFMVLGSVDPGGLPWGTLLTGVPGFVSSPDPRTLTIAARRDPGDPAAAGLAPGCGLALLGIELHSRRRNRMNGTITQIDEQRIDVAVEHSFGNCPKYVRARSFNPRAAPPDGTAGHSQRFVGLDARARKIVAAADTFFVTSYVELEGRLQVDVAHRGGPAGFVRVGADGTLTIPDYVGNRFFNTLGNVAVQPRVGLLFIEFETGGLLQITGEAELLLDGDPSLEGGTLSESQIERAWLVRPHHGQHRHVALSG